MQLKQLEYVIKVAECGSITQAAEQLFVSQPSLTKSIINLEEEYGVSLFVRKHRGVELTNEGKNFIYYAKSVVTAADALNENFAADGSERASRLFIATQQIEFIDDLVLRVFKQSQRQDFHYSLVKTDRNSVTRQVLSGQVDLGIAVRSSTDKKTFLWHVDAKKLEIQTLAHSNPYVCIGPKSPYYGRPHITFSEAEQCTHIVLDMEQNATESRCFDSSLNHFNTNKLIFFNSISACERFLLETDALLYASKWTIGCFKDPQIQAIQVVPEQEDEVMPVNDLLLLKRAGEPLTPLELQFVCLLEEYCAENQE